MTTETGATRMPIDDLLIRLGERFGHEALPIRERWDEDVCAVGCVVAGEGERLVFVCPSSGTAGTYDATAEPGARRVAGLSFEALVQLVEEHVRAE